MRTQLNLFFTEWTLCLKGIYGKKGIKIFKDLVFSVTCPTDEWVFSDLEISSKVISPAVRMSLKLHQDHFTAVDDFEEINLLYERIQNYQTKIFISHEVLI